MKIKSVIYTQTFKKNVKQLYKKYKKIFDDLESFEKELKKSQEPIGDRLQEFEGFHVYKARIKNSSSNTGKRGGFRVIYYVESVKDEISIFITVYSKNEQGNVSRKEIEDILRADGLV